MELNIQEIENILPHRYPFLLVDRVLESDETSITALKNVSANEPFFMGHFPTKKVMPGVLITESLAQAGAILLLSNSEYKNKIPYFAGIDKFKFRRVVVPGDTLILKVELESFKYPVGIASAKAYVGDTLCASGILKFALGD